MLPLFTRWIEKCIILALLLQVSNRVIESCANNIITALGYFGEKAQIIHGSPTILCFPPENTCPLGSGHYGVINQTENFIPAYKYCFAMMWLSLHDSLNILPVYHFAFTLIIEIANTSLASVQIVGQIWTIQSDANGSFRHCS